MLGIKRVKTKTAGERRMTTDLEIFKENWDMIHKALWDKHDRELFEILGIEEERGAKG